MRAYGLRRQDRHKCTVKNCKCAELSAKYPIREASKSSKRYYLANKGLKKRARRDSELKGEFQ